MLNQVGKSNSACGSRSKRRLSPRGTRAGELSTAVVLAFAACLPGSAAPARTPDLNATQTIPTSAPAGCPAPAALDAILAENSDRLRQARYGEVAGALAPLSTLHCDPKVHLLLAAALEGEGDSGSAEQTLIQGHAAWPANSSLAVSLARDYLSSRQTGKAAEALAHFQATPATPPQELQMAAVILLAGQQLAQAQTVAQVAYTTYPSVSSLLLLANTLQLEGKYKDVLTLLGGERAKYAQSAPFLVTFAESEYDAKMFDPARADLEQALKLEPRLPQAHYLLANVLSGQGDLDRAVEQYRAAIALAPKQPRTWYRLALTLRAKEDEAGEEDALQNALAVDSHYALAHSEMGRILLNQGKVPEAVQQLNAAIDENPASEQPYYLLAKAYDKLGDAEKSSATAKRLAEVKRANHRGAADGSPGDTNSQASSK